MEFWNISYAWWIGGLAAGDFILALGCLGIGVIILPPVNDRMLKKKPIRDTAEKPDPATLIEQKYLAAIRQGEHLMMEFKSSLRIDLKTADRKNLSSMRQ